MSLSQDKCHFFFDRIHKISQFFVVVFPQAQTFLTTESSRGSDESIGS